MKVVSLSRRGVMQTMLGMVAAAIAGAGWAPRAPAQTDDAGRGNGAADGLVVRQFDEYGRVVQEVRFDDRARRQTCFYY